ncbi:MAG: divalent metal cation transporter [Planctomycetota bacterium]|nr:divalent metal cation transporter [Planctomycetota bacterium]
MSQNKTFRDREILSAAQDRGSAAMLGAFFKLSGPGWLQSAITLGGGSLGGALYLGMLAGYSMLWLQLVAIVIGVIMLSAISYVTLSTGTRPYTAINEYVNPVLGVGWITATILANMIWIVPQFSLCFDSLDTSLGQVSDTNTMKIIISAVIAIAALVIVGLSFKPGWMSRLFDLFLKLMVGCVVICFVLVVILLFRNGSIQWNEILYGFVPNIFHWSEPAPDIVALASTLSPDAANFWSSKVVESQQSSMIGVTATAVGLNMTFLLPYSMLARGWDKPFRGLARFDLITGMAIPYLIVTSCIVIASAHAFHAKADAEFLSPDPAVIQTSRLFGGAKKVLIGRYDATADNAARQAFSQMDEAAQDKELAKYASTMSAEERKLAATLIKPSAGQLAASLAPVLGKEQANLVFGIGALAMGFSTIIILMLINGYAFAEIAGRYDNNYWRMAGAISAVLVGFFWWWLWAGISKTWLIIVASTFGAILLPIAYISFFALMNNRRLLGDEKPVGTRMIIWNVLMGLGVLGAIAQAVGAIMTKINDPATGGFVIGGVVTFLLLAIVGFSARFRRHDSSASVKAATDDQM